MTDEANISEHTELQDEDKEMYEHFHFLVDPGQEPLRIDKFLQYKIANATRTRIQHALVEGNILINGKPRKTNYKVKPGDEISIVFAYPKREIELIPENIPLNIVYEDEDIIIINKKAGMVVHPGVGNFTGTLMNAALYHYKSLPQKKSNGNDPFSEMRPGLVHRLDKNTSGLIVVTKNEKSINSLANAFFERKVDRRYIALVWGDFVENAITIDAHIGRDLRDRKKMAAFPKGEHGRNAVTHIKVLERFKYVTLVECKLETGRTHQIRVHLQHIGHPVFNDEVYGGDKILRGQINAKYRQFVENCFVIMPRQALHALTLGFIHPTTGKPIHFESDIPEDMKAVIAKWRGRNNK